ncbi:hypothetical protein BAE31_14775 [Bacillus sp. I-2]|nr:hypothetical protein CS953_06210 [Bacillus safensis]KIL11363.1 hypothetical protein B4107_1977 [Bacillus safensis]KRE15198.1 hypothetical protein ASE42_11175 [Bacillus sp. Root920]MBG9822256.1 hypothetical protein [Bacillus safensis]OMP26266.1 hypothetical protein BAE31_14775 [Bacillus sp. I-2]
MIAPLSVFFLYTDKLHVRFRKERFIFHCYSPKNKKIKHSAQNLARLLDALLLMVYSGTII